MDLQQFESRKRDHLQHALDAKNQTPSLSGLESVRIPHEALPDLDFEQITLEMPFLDRKLTTPFFVPGMTAGHPDAAEINRRIARQCSDRGWIMGVGSQRRDLISEPIEDWAQFRSQFRDLFVISNLGISQVIQAPLDQVRRVVDTLDADLLMVHLNPLQEALQGEGTPQFAGAFLALERLVRQLGRPVGVKETGCGFSPSTLKRLKQLGLAAIDCSGLGGTHWGRIEGARAEAGSPQAMAAAAFADWGVPTVDSVRGAAQVLGDTDTEIWASGGVRNGLDAAKLVWLGAHRVGAARPVLENALQSEEHLARWMQQQEYELKVALFCTGSARVSELRAQRLTGGVNV